jgi:hypothetical protein
MLVITDQFSANPEMFEQFACVPRVFARDQVNRFERFYRAGGDVCEVSDGSGDKKKRSRHRMKNRSTAPEKQKARAV